MSRRWSALVAILVVVGLVLYYGLHQPPPIRIGSKKFTEAVILGEMLTQIVEQGGHENKHVAELGGTRVLFNALLNGDLDIYPEYTGTIALEILADRNLSGDDEVRAALAEMGVEMSAPLGFNNTYALGMTKPTAERLGIRTYSELRDFPELRFGFTNEFMDRGDGWPSLRERYQLPQTDVRGLDHDIAYRALANGDVDVIDFYSTDAEIDYYDLHVLDDDLRHFPIYNAVILYRSDLEQRKPGLATALRRLEGRIDAAAMGAMNARVKIERQSEKRVAADFLREALGISSVVRELTIGQRLRQRTGEHLGLVLKSMIPAILVAVPLGIWAAKWPTGGQAILATVGVIQTIPALALLVLLMRPLKMIGLKGIEEPPAIAALFLYSLLPIVRNTHAGLRSIAPHIRESAEALGLTASARLWRIELPLASRMILAGIKTAAVINIGFATLGALIGAGGFGQPILTGIRLDDQGLILEGALPAAGLALVVQGAFELLERGVVPRGLRLKAA